MGLRFSGLCFSRNRSNLESFANRLSLNPPALRPLPLHRDPEQLAHIFANNQGSSADRIPPPHGIHEFASRLKEVPAEAEERAKGTSYWGESTSNAYTEDLGEKTAPVTRVLGQPEQLGSGCWGGPREVERAGEQAHA